MKVVRSLARPVSCLAIAGTLSWSLPAVPAHAALVDSETVIGQAQASADRARVHDFLSREEVRAQMQAMGIDADEASRRVGSMTDAEIAQISGRLGELPAGQDIGVVLGIALVVFVILLITDIAGVTKVFPFTRSVR